MINIWFISFTAQIIAMIWAFGLPAVEGGCVLICCWTEDIYWSYAGFVLFGALYGFTITVAR